MINANRTHLPRAAFAVRYAEALAAILLVAAAAQSSAALDAPAGQAPVAAAETAGQQRLLDGIVAVVDGDPITLRELKRYGVTGAPFLPPEVRADYRSLLESMIEHRLLKAEFDKNGITAPDAMVDRYIASVLEETKQTRQALELDVTKAGLTWKDYYERMREEVERIQLVNLLIRSRVNVPEEEVRAVWEADPEFLESEKLEVGVIFLPSGGDEAAREAAVKVQKEARRNFEDAAKKYSKGPAASEGGHLGDFKRGTMAPHFEKGLEDLGEGEVSDPVAGPGGFYLVKLIDIKASGRRSFDEVKEELADKLYEKRLNERYRKWATEDLRRDHHVDIMVDKLALIAATS